MARTGLRTRRTHPGRTRLRLVARKNNASLGLLTAELQPIIAGFLGQHTTTAERVQALEAALMSPAGQMLRSTMGQFIVEVLSALIPEHYTRWRTLVQDAMFFVVMHLSPERLAPKLVQQLELPSQTPPETRLLQLIARVPGLQKIGQVLARNRHLAPSLRRALSELENGISDVTADEIHAIIFAELGPRVETYGVELEEGIFSEASVSAVVRFTWRNPAKGRRERGVFKVIKPHILPYYSEDMKFLQALAEFLGRNHGKYGVSSRGLADTFGKVRRLLQREVNFRGEQRTLRRAYRFYGSLRGVRVPRLIQSLSTSTITALSEERGVKVTDAVAQMPAWRRDRVAEQVIETLVAVPLFATREKTMFHADPHAGNLLYDTETGELVLIDWALTETLTRAQRRHLALLFLMIVLRDTVGVSGEIQALSQSGASGNGWKENMIRKCVVRFVNQLPLTRLPGVVDAMRLVERLGLEGIRFPAPLIMLSKVMSTLDGILHDLAAPNTRVECILSWYLLRHWATSPSTIGAPLSLTDWIRVQSSAMFYGSRVLTQWAHTLWNRSLPIPEALGHQA